MTWYPVIMGLAIATAIVLSRATQRSLPLTKAQKLGIGLGAFCGAMIGSKLPFLLADWESLLTSGVWFSDGKTIVCGLVGGYFGVEFAKWALDIRIKTGDSFAVPVAAAVSIGRIACYSGRCCFGAVTRLPWGVDFGDGLARHPTQLYEAAFHAIAAIVLYILSRRSLFRGQLIKLYIIAYLVYRFASEFIRPEPDLWLGLTGYQWAALLLIPLFAWLWSRDARRFRQERRPSNPTARGE